MHDDYEPQNPPYLDPWEAYWASKAKSYQETKGFIRDYNPPFDVVIVIPSFVLGRHELVADPAALLKTSNWTVLGPALGKSYPIAIPGCTVSVDDIARMHLQALGTSITGHQTYVVSSDTPDGIVFNDALKFIHRHFPHEIDQGLLEPTGNLPTKAIRLDSRAAIAAFGPFLGFESQVAQTVKQYIELVRRSAEIEPRS